MPTGYYDFISPVLHAIDQHYGFPKNPFTRLLDVGVGFGKWGVLMREYFACWYRSAPNFLTAYHSVQLEGIEIFQDYSNPVWGVYNQVHLMSIVDFIKRDSRTWDGITCMDVIEHLPEHDGNFVLKNLAERTTGFITLSFPPEDDNNFFSQGTVYGNVHEAHLSPWSIERCRKLAPMLSWKEILPGCAVIGVR